MKHFPRKLTELKRNVNLHLEYSFFVHLKKIVKESAQPEN